MNVEPLTKSELLNMLIAPALEPVLFRKVELKIAMLDDSLALIAPAKTHKIVQRAFWERAANCS